MEYQSIKIPRTSTKFLCRKVPNKTHRTRSHTKPTAMVQPGHPSRTSCLLVLFLIKTAAFSTAEPLCIRLPRSRFTNFATTKQHFIYDIPNNNDNNNANSLHSNRSLQVRGGAAAVASTEAVSSLFQTLDSLWTSHPYIAACVVCAVKACSADWIAQRGASQKFDFRRNLSFLLYGALYQGMVQEFIYNTLYTQWFGAATTLRVVATKVLFDAFFHNALLCVPMAYVVKAVVFGRSVGQGIRNYVYDVRNQGLLYKYYAIWMPTNFIIYSYIPKQWRITFMATVSFFWMILLSTISSRKKSE